MVTWPHNTRRVEAGPDKLAVFESLLQQKLPEGPSVYIGDSPTDILPLLAADVGIVFGGNQTLRRVLHAAGVELRCLEDGAVITSVDMSVPVLFFADDWHTIGRALLIESNC